MSFISDIVNQRLHPSSALPGDVLMRWTEPTAIYWRKRLGVFRFLSWWLAGDSMIDLKVDCVHQRIGGRGAGGADGFRSAYADIESCTIHHDSYKGVKFSVVRLKNKHKLVRIVIPVQLFVVPGDVDADAVVKILRDHGVQVFEE